MESQQREHRRCLDDTIRQIQDTAAAEDEFAGIELALMETNHRINTTLNENAKIRDALEG